VSGVGSPGCVRLDRREFLQSVAALAALGALPAGCATSSLPLGSVEPRRRNPAKIRGAFFYPPAEVVLAGKLEDSWHVHQWFTWPGNQFQPEVQQQRFTEQVRRIISGLDLSLQLDDAPIYTDARIASFIEEVKRTKPDALLLFHFWNSFSPKMRRILDAFDGPIILYHPLGANHQLPPDYLRTAARVQYIHSVENWEALERGLRVIHAHTRMASSRLLRVSGKVTGESDVREPFFGTAIHTVPADHFNNLFDQTTLTPELERLAVSVRRNAVRVTDLSEKAFWDAVRAHAAVNALMARHEADAITIQCLFLKHRKPCLSFALNNGRLAPCGCENDLNASLTLMFGAACFGRAGFQHNPEYDTERNLYFGAHCTCALALHGPSAKPAPYVLRPFFHQMPKTLALDVQWPVGERVTLCKYHSGKNLWDAWSGESLGSPGCPPTGGCATRVLVRLDKVANVCDVYPGPHPVLYCGDFTRHLKTHAQLYKLDIRTNL